MVTAQVSCAYSPQDSLALVIVPLHPLGAGGFGWGEAEGGVYMAGSLLQDL